jgi:hypothetical protein
MTQICKSIGDIILIGHPKVKSSRVRINLLKRGLMAFIYEDDEHTLLLLPYTYNEKCRIRNIDFMETGYNDSLFSCKLVEVDDV